MADLKIENERINSIFERLSNIGRLQSPQRGYLRASWSDEETAAMELIKEFARSHGFQSEYDSIGNLHIRIGDIKNGVILTGSHLDTVPQGGNYDGALGVIAGLEAMTAIVESGLGLNKGIELIAWRGEESGTFDVGYKGSKAAFGILPRTALQRTFKGITLEEAIKTQGFNTSFIEEEKRIFSDNYIDSINGNIELHIEQGSVLETKGRDIGIVTSIRGPARFLVEVEGRFDHSGATPMGINYRKDANLAIAYMQVAMNELASRFNNMDLVQTVGILNTDIQINNNEPRVYQNGLTKVSGYGYFKFDVRSRDKQFRDSYLEEIKKLIVYTAQEFRVSVNIKPLGAEDPVEHLDSGIQSLIERECRELGHMFYYLPSGAGHDAGIIAKQKRTDGTTIPTAMIFIPCRYGISHAPEEFASMESIIKGTRVLAGVMYEMAR